MSQIRPTPRYAHSEGHTDVCYSDDGSYIVTCGSEGDFRIWKGFDDDDPFDKCVGDKAFAVAQKGDKLYVGSDHNNVQIFTFPEGEPDGTLTRFTAPVTTISISKDGGYVAAGSSDMDIHLVDVTTSKVTHFQGHRAPILHVAIDPKLEYLASSSCDGTVRIWNVLDQSVAKTFPNVLKTSNSFESTATVCHLSWEPCTGRLLAVPQGAEIKVYQRSTWNEMMTLQDSESSEIFGLTSWSACGTYLAASNIKGKIVIWNSLVSRIVSSFIDEGGEFNITALCWNPDTQKKELALCDANGQLAVIENCNAKPISTMSFSKTKKENPLTDAGKETSGKENSINYNEALLRNNDDLMYQFLPNSVKEDADDPDAISLEKIKNDFRFVVLPKGDTEDDDSSLKSDSPRRPSSHNIQLPFQPTSTPVHLQRRFMVFNDIGYVRQTNTEDENVIDVDFHEASIHHSFRITNVLNHVFAALSANALALACESSEDSMSKLVCRLFNSWDDSKEWSIEMPQDEDIRAVAIGNKWIAVVTSLWYLRIFSLSGIQREIISLPGPVVSMNGSNDYLFVVYHSSFGDSDCQYMGFQVFTINNQTSAIVSAQPLPLSPCSTLKWVGFSDEMNPCILDSSGILKIYVYKLGSWSPICNVDEGAKESSNHHFVIGVSEGFQNVRGILCKGSFYPATTPHPFITEIPWKIPICEANIDKGELEEQLWRQKIADKCLCKDDEKLRVEITKTALKLFALCCRTSHEMRAFELCDFVDQSKFTELALKFSAKGEKNLLVEKIEEFRFEQQKKAEEDLNDFDFGPSNQSGMSNGCHSFRSDLHVEPGPRNYQSQELFTDVDNTQVSSICSNDTSVSLIVEMKKKKKSLSEQKNQVIPRRKINPFRKDIPSNDVSLPGPSSNINATSNKDSQDTSSSLLDSQDVEKNNSISESSSPEETGLTSRKRKSPVEYEKNPEKKKSLTKLHAFAFKKQT